MKINILIDYKANWGQTVCICGSIPAFGCWNENIALGMTNVSSSVWATEIEVDDATEIEYYYLIKDQNNIINKEWGKPHFLYLETNKVFDIQDIWQNTPSQKFLYTSGFCNSFFLHENKTEIKYTQKSILINVTCPYVKKNQSLILCGSSDALGNWNTEHALHFNPIRYALWQVAIDASLIEESQEYKLAIYDNISKKIIHWDERDNQILHPLPSDIKENFIKVISFAYSYNFMNWKATGVAIPIFSLRSDNSSGIGEFYDLKKMVDWATITGQKIIQVLPINDTTSTYSWTDSYPYNAISTYALHPLYLGLKEYPLKDENTYKSYLQEFEQLNKLPEIDYQQVGKTKWAYIKELYREIGCDILKENNYLDFYDKNKEWLFTYACFCFLRDKFQSAKINQWGEYSTYNKQRLEELINSDHNAQDSIRFVYFTQYLLHKQLIEVKEYAHKNGVILKGDIPIGISRNSVEAWIEPYLFNLDTQTGAPPDDFSLSGQNWGFPTYNWDEMAKDGYQWWVKRFRKMADYFDAYRIDHILGFFRIWEIPSSSVEGLLGYFSPALPLSIDEIHKAGMWFDNYRMTSPYIHEHFLGNIFGEYKQEVIDKYLNNISYERYELKEECNTQVKIKLIFTNDNDEKNLYIRNGLYSLCNEVLFIRDKYDPEKYHPRIAAQHSHSFKDLDDQAKDAFDKLYVYFFYFRHSEFWREQAMKKLPDLISSTSMLVCGEDLGMVPTCVPSVMEELQILSLEIERMPKEIHAHFSNLSELPYQSVCTTSTHDMPPIRLWWKESKEIIQEYYNEILHREGIAPEDCDSELCQQIIHNHLNAPAMLVILPLQDWLSTSDRLKRVNAEEERINIPAVPQHYWQYRMHLTLEELIDATDFNAYIRFAIETSDRL